MHDSRGDNTRIVFTQVTDKYHCYEHSLRTVTYNYVTGRGFEDYDNLSSNYHKNDASNYSGINNYTGEDEARNPECSFP